MLKRLFLLMNVVWFISGCAMPTKYMSDQGEGGYSEAKINKLLYLTRFKGNSRTSKQDALDYSIFRAVEICRDNKIKLARLFFIFDFTKEEKVFHTWTSTFQSPSFVSSILSDFGGNVIVQSSVTQGSGYSITNSWSDIITTPQFHTIFACAENQITIDLDLVAVSKDEMKILVKDLLGGMQIHSLAGSSPLNKYFKYGDIITKVNDQRVQDPAMFSYAIETTVEHNIKINFYRDGKEQVVSVQKIDVSDDALKTQGALIRKVCEKIKNQTFPREWPEICTDNKD